MAGRILSIVFWLAALFLVSLTLVQGGWAYLVPAAVLMAFLIFIVDLFHHREIITLDLDMLRTMLHVLSAVTLAATGLYWLGLYLLGTGW